MRSFYFIRYIFEILGQAGITPGNQAQTQELVDQIIGASISMESGFNLLDI